MRSCESLGFTILLLQYLVTCVLRETSSQQVETCVYSYRKSKSDTYRQYGSSKDLQSFPILEFPRFSGGLIRRRRDWVIPPVSFPENDRGPFPKAVIQIKSSYAKDVMITYKITGQGADQPPEGLFTVDRRSGMLFVTKPLDRENIEEYKLKAHAFTLDYGNAEEPMDIIIKVVDQNDNRPQFTHNPALGNVSETAPLDYSFMRVTAVDLDDPTTENAIIRYQIKKQEPRLPNAEMFSINQVSGAISLASVGLDRETHAEYKLVIEAADMEGRGLSTSCTAIITVIDSNDHAPKFSHKTYTGSIEENKQGGVVVRLSVTDLDEPLTATSATRYTIVKGNENGLFSISTGPSKMEGIITTAKGLDFEQNRRFTLLVAVENDVPFAVPLPTSTATVIVNVEDLNEAPIFMPEQKQVTAAEDLTVGSVITEYKAKDPDTTRKQAVRYKVLEDDAGWLEVTKDTGLVKVRNLLDRESLFIRGGTYKAIILAYDNDTVPASGSGTLLIEVGDVNDHAPLLEQRQVQFCSDQPIPIPLTITDADGPGNAGPFTVELRSGAQSNWTVTTNSTSSEVRLSPRRQLDPDEYHLVLRLYDTQMLFQDCSLLVEVCQCSGAVYTCDHRLPSPQSIVVPPFSIAVLVAILCLLLLLLLLLFLVRRKNGVKDVLLQEEEVRDNIYYYDEEGGGEEDQEYDLSQLHRGLDNRLEVFCTDIVPTLLPALAYRPRPEENEEIGHFIHDNLCAADSDPTAPPYDSLLVFDYEGVGSEAGSLSSLQSCSSGRDQDYLHLSDWGTHFRKLADMYGGGEDCDSDTLPGKTECSCGHCHRMADVRENICCREIDKVMAKCGEVDEVVACMTAHPGFAPVCLNPWVLQVADASYRQEHGDFEAPINRRYRHAAYRNFVLWCWGYLGKRVRVRLPACVVMGIRLNFPDPSGDYTGFKWPPL